MSKITIIPYEGFGEIRFGESRETVRNKLGNFSEFKKTKFSKNTTDDFGFCHVYYTTDNTVAAVEFFPEAEVSLNDKLLFTLSYSDAKVFLSDSAIEEDGCGAKFPKYGISIFSPELGKIETILIYSKKYWGK